MSYDPVLAAAKDENTGARPGTNTRDSKNRVSFARYRANRRNKYENTVFSVRFYDRRQSISVTTYTHIYLSYTNEKHDDHTHTHTCRW